MDCENGGSGYKYESRVGEPILGIGDCQPTLLKCGLLPELPEWRCSGCVGGSKIGGGPYIAG